MKIIFCADPLNARMPDPAYATEIAAARAVGATYALIDYEALVQEQATARAIRLVQPASARTVALYRGWMMTPEQYAALYRTLEERGIALLNDPTAYRHCHYLPESYAIIEAHTPRTVWLPAGDDLSLPAILAAVRPFGSAPLIVKDYVKSRKHEWLEACYIPAADDAATVERVVQTFLDRQGSDLEGGLVFREYMEFAPIGTHSRSGMPLTREYRSFWLDGAPLLCAPYWEEGDYGAGMPPLHPFQDVARAVRSRFFSMDLAQRRDGTWMIIELGDGQVAGLPASLDPSRFYNALNAHWPAS